MNRIITVILFCLALTFSSARAGLIEPRLLDELSGLDADERVEVMVIIAEQLDGESIIRNIKDKATRRSHTISALKELSGRTQAGLLAELEIQRGLGKVGTVIPFWLANAVYCELTPDLVFAIAERPEVMAAQSNRVHSTNLFNFETGTTVPDMTARTGSVEWNVAKVKADSVWQIYGLTGKNVLIGNIDSGVDYTHPDLAGRMWLDPNYPNHGWNFRENTNDPMDWNGHGTHTAGTHSGDGTGGRQTGIAPGSSVMACRIKIDLAHPMPDEFAENTVMSAMQFCVEPPLSPDSPADLISMSLGWNLAWRPRQALWRTSVANVAAAGLPFFISAGNDGRSGLNCPGHSPSPWHNPVDQPGGLGGAITIGATDRDDNIAGFSSRGPVTWAGIDPFNDYPRPPGLIKPDFSAPGVSVVSTRRTGGYTDMSGTSMSAPCAAGIAALMLERNPNLLPEEVNEIMENSVVPRGARPKNNDYGTGRICAMLAVQNTPLLANDVAAAAVLAPDSMVDARTPLAPRVRLENRGARSQPAVPVHCRIDSLGTTIYRQTVTTAVDSGASTTAVFPDWRPGPSRNSYELTFWHSLPGDEHRYNDTINSVTTTRFHDVATVQTNLSQRVRAGRQLNPTVTLLSADHTERGFRVHIKVDSAGTGIYLDSARVDSVPAYGRRTFTFSRPFTVGEAGRRYQVRVWHNCPTDEDRGNDTLVTAFEAAGAIRVLWLYSDFSPPDSTIGDPLRALGDSIEYFDARVATPDLARLTPYNVVGAHSNSSFDNPAALGDVLADYIAAGGAVVLGNRCFTTDRGMAGRLMTGDYATIDRGANTQRPTALGWHRPDHGTMVGIGAVGETNAASGGFNPAADSVARWQDGRPYVAVSRNRRVVAVNSYPGHVASPDRTGDWAMVFINALHYAAGIAAGVEEFDPFRPALNVELSAAPSPARAGVLVNYLVPSGSDYTIGIYDINGRLVRNLVRGSATAGLQRARWDITDAEGRRVASGIYFCRLTAGDRAETRKLVIE